MKKVSYLLILLCAVLFSSCLKEISYYGYNETTICRGVVLESMTNKPLANVKISATNGVVIDNEVYTAADGTYEIPISIEKLRDDYYLVASCDSLMQDYLVGVNNIVIGSQYYDVDTIFLSGQMLPYPQVYAPHDITPTSAICSGAIFLNGYAIIEECGFVYDTIKYPTLANHSVVAELDNSRFSATITIQPNTHYYVRAYAKNSVGVGYSEPESFYSGSVLPDLTTAEVTDIASFSVTCGGNVLSEGGSKILSRGLCWSTSPNPTINSAYKTVGSGLGSFSTTVTNLQPNKSYYIRAFAKNESGVSYGEQRFFTTMDGIPSVITADVQSVTSTSAIAGGEVLSDAGIMVIRRGICYSASPMPTISSSHTSDGSGLGVFQSTLLGLSANTTYYYRAYATNGVGTVYGEQKSFVTE